ncbi:hypothetical protein PoB_002623500 [Plakobranchus ocellatus]|uniref:Uncharacterized protein n=1 Tax=Plakobranchus ocellatus TaxID=259542 RepID=A0AAV3ZYI4_9GAST|nr:hypothetical protein PoB_002623500 [Plakobranchus ocellatus]
MYQSKPPMEDITANFTEIQSDASKMAELSIKTISITSGRTVGMRMFPWLLPVSVAVAMVIFLACSFSHHHKRFLQQRRHASRHYLHEYRRVAGPIFSLAATLSATPDAATSHDGKDTDQAISFPSARAFTKRLRRCYSWSPRIFKNKHMSTLRNGVGSTAIRKHFVESGDSGSSTHAQVSASHVLLDDPKLPEKIVEEIKKLTGASQEKLNAEVYALAHWASLSRSNRGRSRSLVVTTSSGALATGAAQCEKDGASTDEILVDVSMNSTHQTHFPSVSNDLCLEPPAAYLNPTMHAMKNQENDKGLIWSNDQEGKFPLLHVMEADRGAGGYPDYALKKINSKKIPVIQITPSVDKLSGKFMEANADTAWSRKATDIPCGSAFSLNNISDRNVPSGSYLLQPSPTLMQEPNQCTGSLLENATGQRNIYRSDNCFLTNLSRGIENEDSVCEAMRFCHRQSSRDVQENRQSDDNVFIPERSPWTAHVPCSSVTLNSICQLHHLIKTLLQFWIPSADKNNSSQFERNTKNASHILDEADTSTQCLQGNHRFQTFVPQNRIESMNPFRVSDTLQDSCQRCAAISGIFATFERSDFDNIEAFVTRALVQTKQGSRTTCVPHTPK